MTTATVEPFAHQLPLFSLPRPSADRFRYVVEINECGIFANGPAAEWWVRNVLMRPIGNRLDWLTVNLGGGIAQLPCEDKEEAEFVRDYMLENGVHRTHAKVKRLGRTPRKG
jgi:hypothetical protein